MSSKLGLSFYNTVNGTFVVADELHVYMGSGNSSLNVENGKTRISATDRTLVIALLVDKKTNKQTDRMLCFKQFCDQFCFDI